MLKITLKHDITIKKAPGPYVIPMAMIAIKAIILVQLKEIGSFFFGSVSAD
jgi:hypothetical protein